MRLSELRGPADLKRLKHRDLDALAADIRAFLVEKVARTGGHLGPNLGVVELSIALHRVFDSPQDAILFDTGHQSYIHKLLTGRQAGFDQLRQVDGLSGYPSRSESEHDIIENSHASTALSWADGIATAWELTGELKRRHVVAVIGDGAMTGGLAWEAINNIAGKPDRPLVVVVNDNGRSYSPTIGGLASHLAALRASHQYEEVLGWGKRTVLRIPRFGRLVYRALHALKRGMGDLLLPQGMFQNLGLKYIGPVNGHDIAAVEHVLKLARDFDGPVLVHVITSKGKGYEPAELDEADKFHGIGAIDPLNGHPLKGPVRSWTDAFSDSLLEVGTERQDVVAITAAMLGPTGLEPFQKLFPSRTFDVGIAEQHALTSAAGMAFAGLHPVVAVYATFINRAYDQLLMDCAMHKAPVTVVLDRAGVTGDDGASHNGMWDLALLGSIPGLLMHAPRDGATLRSALRACVDYQTGPSVVRFPKGAVPLDVSTVEDFEGCALLKAGDTSRVIVGVGAFAQLALDTAELCGDGASVVSLTQVLPIPEDFISLVAKAQTVFVIEDGLVEGGVADRVRRILQERSINCEVHGFGVPRQFLAQATRGQVLDRIGLTAEQLSAQFAAVRTNR